ncbi:MAG: SGNH/GDSL hydrolase family protein [Lachnospiraceae bacterium]|jgi:lysophospholipase L1-like esterase|nr:SGNH/GDSL hydrolase family protein [Lachnospiraceae bacterium]
MTNRERLERCFDRAEQGEALTLGFFGGSITMGSLASSDEKCYCCLVCEWWKERFPGAEIACVNGGIGGTDSLFGVSRVNEDLLMYRPDLVVVDFSVNDEATLFCQETFEGLLRRILTAPSAPAVIVLNNVFYDTGESAQDLHNAVAAHYGIGSVSIRDTIWKMVRDGRIRREEISPDGLHPNDRGHRMVADEIIRYLDKVSEGRTADASVRASLCAPQTDQLPEPLTADRYEKAVRLNITDSCPELMGFRADAAEKMGHRDFFRNGWTGRRLGERIRFQAECSCIAVQYRKTIDHPAPVAQLILDGDSAHPLILDANFGETWGDCLYLQKVLDHGARKLHTVEIVISGTHADDRKPFYLLSLITA